MNDNKLIAEFMGLEIHESKHKYITTYYVTIDGVPTDLQDLQYHASWDWLMPVVEKIEQVNEGVPEQMLHVNLYSERREVYNAVVEFIKEKN